MPDEPAKDNTPATDPTPDTGKKDDGKGKDPSKKPLTKDEKERGAVKRSLTGIPMDENNHPIDIPKFSDRHRPKDELLEKAKSDTGK